MTNSTKRRLGNSEKGIWPQKKLESKYKPDYPFDSENAFQKELNTYMSTKDNVRGNSIGTILTDGYRSGSDVRAEIIIHDTDSMRE